MEGAVLTKRKNSEDFRKKIMKSSGFTGPSAGPHETISGTAAPGKAVAHRQRLAEALRANLGRRKVQKKERAKQAGATA